MLVIWILGPAGIAQLVEHLIRNQGVSSSNLLTGSSIKRLRFFLQSLFLSHDSLLLSDPPIYIFTHIQCKRKPDKSKADKLFSGKGFVKQ